MTLLCVLIYTPSHKYTLSTHPLNPPPHSPLACHQVGVEIHPLLQDSLFARLAQSYLQAVADGAVRGDLYPEMMGQGSVTEGQEGEEDAAR